MELTPQSLTAFALLAIFALSFSASAGEQKQNPLPNHGQLQTAPFKTVGEGFDLVQNSGRRANFPPTPSVPAATSFGFGSATSSTTTTIYPPHRVCWDRSV
jgi:hypothetical protein